MITTEEYVRLQLRFAEFEKWRNGRTSYKPEDIPADVPTVTNAERSAMEVYEFCTFIPSRYFLYIRQKSPQYGDATTWTGEYLGSATFGPSYRSTFGDTRMPVSIMAVNGKRYHGTYYCDAGDYARVKLSKRQ